MVKRRWPALIVTLWSVLSLFAGVALMSYGLLEASFAGDALPGKNSDQPPPPISRVSYTLLALQYFNRDGLLTGPHRALPFTLGWLSLTALLMALLWRRWRVGTARRVLRISLISLALVTVVGGLTLTLAERAHNHLLAQPTFGLAEPDPVGMTSASVATLEVWRCVRWVEDQGCVERRDSTFPNPILWGILAVFIAASAGLWRSSWERQ